MHELTGFQRDLLYVIAGLDDPKGLAIKDEIETYYGSTVHQGRLYPNLDEVVDQGLVEKGQRDRRTNYYRLTEDGRRALSRRRAWEHGYVEDQVEVGAEAGIGD